jgi:hypothetical protein
LDTDYLRVMKELRNAAIHPNEGNVSKQATFEESLLMG